jgi:hypothetical protein
MAAALALSPALVAQLANLAPCDGVYVFPWRSRSGVYKWWSPLCRRLGIKATPHMFRHALGEEAIDAEIDLLTLMSMGAWSSVNSARGTLAPASGGCGRRTRSGPA